MAVIVICPMCQEHDRGRVEMTWKAEKETGNDFECPTCGTYRHVTKDKTGGTVGAGQRSDGRRLVSTGFGPGTATFRGKRGVV